MWCGVSSFSMKQTIQNKWQDRLAWEPRGTRICQSSILLYGHHVDVVRGGFHSAVPLVIATNQIMLCSRWLQTAVAKKAEIGEIIHEAREGKIWAFVLTLKGRQTFRLGSTWKYVIGDVYT